MTTAPSGGAADSARSGEESPRTGGLPAFAAGSLALLVLISLARIPGYLLFHSLAELVSVVIAVAYAIVAWLSRRRASGNPLVALGLAYFFVAVLDLFHTLAYAGMNVIVGYDFPANQIWVQARFLEALALLAFPSLGLGRRGALAAFLAACSAYVLLGLASVFVLRVFPACYVAGVGQTPFKVGAELAIVALLVAAFLRTRRAATGPTAPYAGELRASILLTIASELCFMTYVSNYDVVNMAGHLLKILSFLLVYRAIVASCVERPAELLYDRLNASLEELRAANRTKDEFISLLGHDLRNPLSGVHGVAKLLAEGHALGETERREVLVEMERSSRSALELLERVLSWARLQSGALVPVRTEVTVGPLVASVLESVGSAAMAKGVSIEAEDSGGRSAYGDPDMIAAVLRNLLSNAVKFSRRGGRVRLRLGGGATVREFRVEDEGVGMGPAELARVFAVTRRLSRPGTEGEKGAGFGLALSAEFARRMGGSLRAEGEEGKGCAFTLELPEPGTPPS